MEMKKNPKIDLAKKRPMFLSIGLMLSLLLVSSAFEWTSQNEHYYTDEVFNVWDDEPIEAIATTQAPPPKPKVILPVFEEVEDEIELDEVEIVMDPDELDEIEIEYFEEPMTVDVADDFPVNIAEFMPEPVGGMLAFQKFLVKNIKYPNQAKRMGIEGRVYVQFVVDKQGNLTEIKTIKGIGAGCDEEAVRVMSLLPKWKAGKQGYKRVAVRMIVPITFRLG